MSLRDLDLNLLKVFDAIYVAGSVSGAARRLKISQPSISRRLNSLREHFDDPLFERSGNGVAPTAKALTLLDPVRGALSLIDSATESDDGFNPATDNRHFRLVLPDFVEAQVMPHLVNSLPERSGVTFEVMPYASVDLSRVFAEGLADVGVFPFLPNADNIAYSKLFSDRGALITRRDHPALSGGFSIDLLNRLSFIDLPEHIYRMYRIDELLRTRGVERQVAYVTHKVSSVPRIVSETDLVAFLPRMSARFLSERGEVDMFDMPGLEGAQQNVYLTHAKGAENDPATAWLCDMFASAYTDR